MWWDNEILVTLQFIIFIGGLTLGFAWGYDKGVGNMLKKYEERMLRLELEAWDRALSDRR